MIAVGAEAGYKRRGSRLSAPASPRRIRRAAALAVPAAVGGSGLLAAFLLGPGLPGLLMLIIGGLENNPILMLFTLLLGAFMVTGLGFLLASVGRDMLSVMGWGVLVMLILGLPAFAVIFPFSTSIWIELIPSYYLVETVNLVANFGASWADVGGNLFIMFLWGIGFLLLGIFVLGRKLR